MVPLYTNYLTTEEYGTADLVFTVAQFLTPIMSMQLFDMACQRTLKERMSFGWATILLE